MFQRIKASIDQALEQEQARTRGVQRSPSNAGTGARRVASRAISPTKSSHRQGSRNRQESLSRRDPAEFENAFTLDEGDLSRTSTPVPPTERDGSSTDGKRLDTSSGSLEDGAKAKEEDAGTPEAPIELPAEVRLKLRKLEKLESRYQDLLRSYRIAHARVQTVDVFENALRENTPLTTIADPSALIEYLNQINLKGDLVLDELKRVSGERDSFKQRLEEAEKRTKEAYDEAAKLRLNQAGEDADDSVEGDQSAAATTSVARENLTDGDPLGASTKSPPVVPKSPSIGVSKLSLFSPKLKSAPSPKPQEDAQDLFSYDDEIPRLEKEIRTKQETIDGLENNVKSLKTDLAVTRESAQSLVLTLEESSREVNVLREGKDRSEAEARERQDAYDRTTTQLRDDLKVAQTKLQELETTTPVESESKAESLAKKLAAAEADLRTSKEANVQLETKCAALEALQDRVSNLQAELEAAQKSFAEKDKERELAIADLNECKEKLTAAQVAQDQREQSHPAPGPNESSADPSSASQAVAKNAEPTEGNANETAPSSKKNKKKKKKGGKGGGAAAAESVDGPIDPLKSGKLDQAAGTRPGQGSESTVEGLNNELKCLQGALEEKEKSLAGLQAKLKDQEGLQEEIESLRDELVNVGQEHVEVKDRVKNLTEEKRVLEARVTELEHELKKSQGAQSDANAGTDKRYTDLASQFDELKAKASNLQIDLTAAQQLASSRFRDLENLRSSLQKAQPEINQLRIEAAELKTTKESLTKRNAEIKRIDSKHEELRAELSRLKPIIASREAEIKTLSQLNAQESKDRASAQESSNRATQDVAKLEKEKRQAEDNLEKVSRELLKVREDLASHRSRLREMEQQYNKHRSDTEGIREEMELKSAQYASAQSLMSSMRDQTSEMATQLKEARDRCESLDEEVAEAHRLLSERSREGETMRRLLADVEGRAETRIREMKDRMDTAIEERDKAEEEASTAGRRRARENEDLRNKYHDIERSLKRAEMDKEELEYAQRDWKKRRDELESRAGQSAKDMEEVRRAMGDLRDALDDSEKQVRELEKQRAELRRSVEETQHRIEKLHKSNKTLTEELGKARESRKTHEAETHSSSRTSMDSAPRLASPRPGGGHASAPSREVNGGGEGSGAGKLDHAYLKNVLLQFLEQKDRKYQMQLLPVLGMLLQFDKKDEQRWMSAITAKG